MPEQRLIDANKLKAHYAWWGDTEERKIFDDIVDVQPTVNAVALPCKVGDTVWWMNGREILECEVEKIDVVDCGIVIHTYSPEGGFVGFDSGRIGTLIFLTREAAEAALAERRAD